MEGRSVIRFVFMIDDEGGGYRAQSQELSLANAKQVMMLCGDEFKPLSVHFRHARIADEAAYHKPVPSL